MPAKTVLFDVVPFPKTRAYTAEFAVLRKTKMEQHSIVH